MGAQMADMVVRCAGGRYDEWMRRWQIWWLDAQVADMVIGEQVADMVIGEQVADMMVDEHGPRSGPCPYKEEGRSRAVHVHLASLVVCIMVVLSTGVAVIQAGPG